jgi:DNA helicase-2/ATP-dependent DNA helicase PcrA
MTETFVPRPAQKEILAYQSGPMGVSAVPGSGKTFTLSLLAANLVERLAGEESSAEREVLIVTFTNSAVENFRSRIAGFLREERGLLAGIGYRVRTLHGLAHDIVRERPGLVGLSETFDIVDERTANDIKSDAVHAYLRMHPDALSPFIQPQYLQNPRRIERSVIFDAIDIANIFIRIGKELQVEPHELSASLEKQSGTWPLLDFGLRIYSDYQRSLLTRGAVDFDDLIVLALQALRADPDYLLRLQNRWPYVLEDEAQDSSALQESMLRLLTRLNGNWVRVGDPNQAINTTFTSADIRYLREFVAKNAQTSRDLPNSGRSAQPIIDAANFLIDWSRNEHPTLTPDQALTPPPIQPTPPGDPQPNPEAGNPPLYVHDRPLVPAQELEVVVSSLRRWLPENQDKTVAVLAPENHRGFQLTEACQAAGLPYDDSLLRSDSATRAAALALSTVLTYVTRPQMVAPLSKLWIEVWWPRWVKEQAAEEEAKKKSREQSESDTPAPTAAPSSETIPEQVIVFGRALDRLSRPESFLFPDAMDWLDSLAWLDEAEGFRPLLERFRSDLQRWTAATILPVDELLLTLGNDLFTEPAYLALTHRLAVLLAKLSRENPGWRLPELAGELDNIAQNRRRMLGFSEEGLGYEPKSGQITIATMHSAKGLEWDRVYLMAVNNYGFPSGADGDKYRGERWYVRESRNLVAEAEAQLRQLHMGTLDEYVVGEATHQARIDVAAERLRLLYVGVTRARQELILTYNLGRQPERDPNQPALAFRALHDFVDRRSSI